MSTRKLIIASLTALQAGHHELAVMAEEVLEVTASLTGADALALTLDILSGEHAELSCTPSLST